MYSLIDSHILVTIVIGCGYCICSYVVFGLHLVLTGVRVLVMRRVRLIRGRPSLSTTSKPSRNSRPLEGKQFPLLIISNGCSFTSYYYK